MIAVRDDYKCSSLQLPVFFSLLENSGPDVQGIAFLNRDKKGFVFYRDGEVASIAFGTLPGSKLTTWLYVESFSDNGFCLNNDSGSIMCATLEYNEDRSLTLNGTWMRTGTKLKEKLWPFLRLNNSARVAYER